MRYRHKNREQINFSKGVVFTGTACDVLGHDTGNAFIVYDYKGQVGRVCSRPMCGKVLDVVAVDDLTGDEFDELYELLTEVFQPDDDDDDDDPW